MLYALVSSGSFRMSLLAGRFLHSSSAGTSNPWLRICYANRKLLSCLVPPYLTQKALSGSEVAIFASNSNCKRKMEPRALAVKSENKSSELLFHMKCLEKLHRLHSLYNKL
jgi:hypothetical protein